MGGIYKTISLASMLGEYVRAATWRRAVCALAGDSCRASFAPLSSSRHLHLAAFFRDKERPLQAGLRRLRQGRVIRSPRPRAT